MADLSDEELARAADAAEAEAAAAEARAEAARARVDELRRKRRAAVLAGLCPNGHTNSPDQNYCGTCGTPLATDDDAEPLSGTQSATEATTGADWFRTGVQGYRLPLIVGIGACLGILIGCTGAWVVAAVFSIGGLDASAWGRIGVAASALSAVALAVILAARRIRLTSRAAVILAWIVFVVGVCFAAFSLPSVVRVLTLPTADLFGVKLGVQVGWGLWLLAVSSVALAITASLAAQQISRDSGLDVGIDGQPGPATRYRKIAVTSSALIVIAWSIFHITDWNGEDSTFSADEDLYSVQPSKSLSSPTSGGASIPAISSTASSPASPTSAAPELPTTSSVAASGCSTVAAPLADIPARTAQEPRIRIPIPQGWEEWNRDSQHEGIRFAVLAPGLTADGFVPNAFVMMFKLSPGVGTPEKVVKSHLEGYAEGNNLSDITSLPTETCGLPALKSSFKDLDPPPTRETALYVVYATNAATYLVTLQVMARNPDVGSYQQDLTTILDGFQVLPPAE